MKRETPTEAFCRQHGIDPGSFEQSEVHEAMHGHSKKPGLIEQKADAIAQAKAMSEMKFNPSLADYVNIPTNISREDIEQKTGSHPNFKDYDHELEQDRWFEIGGQGGRTDFIEMGDVDDLL